MNKTNKFALFLAPIAVFAIIFICSAVNIKADVKCEQTNININSVTLSWDAPDRPEKYYFGWGETETEARTMVEKKTKKGDGALSTHTITGLKPGTKYYVCISYKVGTSDYITPIVKDFVVYTLPSGKTTGLKCDGIDQALSTATLSWKEQTGVSGYEYKLIGGGKTLSDKTVAAGTTQVTLDINKNTFYSFKVRAYSTRSGKTVYGSWSSVYNFGPQPELINATASKSGLALKWNKISGVKNYTIYVSKTPNKGYKKVDTTTKTSYTVKSLAGSKFNKSNTYYVYIIANKTVKGKTISSIKSSYSAIKDSTITPGVF